MKRDAEGSKRGRAAAGRGISMDLYAKLIQNLIYGPIRQDSLYTSLAWPRA
jgi:hypothetical protein